MDILKNLRPVEALYILDKADKEEWSKTNALAATLAYLDKNGFIKSNVKREANIKFNTTKASRKFIRVYENWCLERISDDYAQGVVDSVCIDNILMTMIDEAFIEKNSKDKSFLWIKWTATKYNHTPKFYDTIDQLEVLKEEIISKRKIGRLDEYLAGMAYAFPSINKDKTYLRYAKKIVGITDETDDYTTDVVTVLNSSNIANNLL